MTGKLSFGVQVSPSHKSWEEILRAFRLAEELGFDYAWVSDHFVTSRGGDEGDILEAWTLLAGLAALTSRIGIGVLVSGNTYRHPSLLAKEAVTVDHISGGRLVLGLGAGWKEDEHRMYGFEFPSAGERVERLEEAAQLIRALLGERRTTFHGRYYRLDDAPFEPKARRPGSIPLLIGADRPRILGVVARRADIWDTTGSREEVEQKVRVLEGHCRAAGRDPGEIVRSVRTDASALDSCGAFESFVRTFESLGFTIFTVSFPGPEREADLRRVATEALPRLRG